MKNKNFEKIDLFLKINYALILMRIFLSFTIRLLNIKIYLVLYIVLYIVTVIFIVIKYFFFYKTIKNNNLKIQRQDYGALFIEVFGRIMLLTSFIWLFIINDSKDLYHNIPLWIGIISYIIGIKMFRECLNKYKNERLY